MLGRLLLVLSGTGWHRARHPGVSAASRGCSKCSVSHYQNTGFGTQPCAFGTDFGCYPGEENIWIRPPCGGFFRCGAEHAAVRCGSRYFNPAPGQTRLNCSCAAPAMPKPRGRVQARSLRSANEGEATRRRSCGEHTAVDPKGGVSAAYIRLPQPADANPSLKCCRNKPTSRGPIDWNVTLRFTNPNHAPWPSACEELCDRHPSGRCRFFSHSVKWKSACAPPACAATPCRG